jgi:hypothetical protein
MQRRNGMRLRHGWIAVIVIVTGLAVPACSHTTVEEGGGQEPASVEPVEGTSLSRVTLSADAAHRLDVQTAPVSKFRGSGGGKQIVIPYSAVIYDPQGDTWTYTSPEHLVFVRSAIRVDRIDGSKAILFSGPSPGTEVVTVGAPELLGVEYPIEGE